MDRIELEWLWVLWPFHEQFSKILFCRVGSFKTWWFIYCCQILKSFFNCYQHLHSQTRIISTRSWENTATVCVYFQSRLIQTLRSSVAGASAVTVLSGWILALKLGDQGNICFIDRYLGVCKIAKSSSSIIRSPERVSKSANREIVV